MLKLIISCHSIFFQDIFFKFFFALKIRDSIDEVDFFSTFDIFLYFNPCMFFNMYAVFCSLFKFSIASNKSLASSFFSSWTPG